MFANGMIIMTAGLLIMGCVTIKPNAVSFVVAVALMCI